MKKVQQAIQRIKVASHIAERHGERLTVCFSGGKDSQVMLHLVQRAGVPFRAVYNVTTIDHPLNVNFIRQNYPIVDFVHPELNFWDLCKKKKALPTMKKRFCCSYLKESSAGYIKAIGVRREESNKRKNYEVAQYEHKGKRIRFYPIIDWLEWEVWEYIEDNSIPVNPCYDFGTRVGCMVCPFASTKQLIARFDEFPALRDKMLRLISDLRRGSRFASDYPDKTNEELLACWMSKKKHERVFSTRI